MTKPRLPAVGRIYKLKGVNEWVKIIQLDTENEEGVWWAEIWRINHGDLWSHQCWIPVEDIMLNRVRDR